MAMLGMTLTDWITKIQSQHRKTMDLGLARVSLVAERLGLTQMPFPVVTVGGTNGKGSTVAALESIWRAAGYRTGAFTSPWLYRFNELIRIDGKAVADEELIEAFQKIEVARRDITLTVFEFNTLAALIIFKSSDLDVGILEVGLGGRLDAVNLISADVSVVTSIGLDHTAILGDTREAIAKEKAGIFRPGRTAICGDSDPPHTLRVEGVPLLVQGKDFGFLRESGTWTFWSQTQTCSGLPLPSLLLPNMATALMVIERLQPALPVSAEAIRQGVREASLPGRIQVTEGSVMEIRDVSHNPAAVLPLSDYLQQTPVTGRTLAVFSMLEDKDIGGVLRVMHDLVDGWFVAALKSERAASLSRLRREFAQENITKVNFHETLTDANSAARERAKPGDRIVIFGSFYTLAAIPP